MNRAMATQPQSGPPPALPVLPRVLAGAVLLLAGLALIALGGCFLIGVMVLVSPRSLGPGTTPPDPSFEAGALIVVLYATAFACFAGAVLFFVLGLRVLFRTMSVPSEAARSGAASPGYPEEKAVSP